jgi:predicted nucleic acid-binding protein
MLALSFKRRPVGHVGHHFRGTDARRRQKPGHGGELIAAHALSAGMILVTNNEREFRRV